MNAAEVEEGQTRDTGLQAAQLQDITEAPAYKRSQTRSTCENQQ